MLPEERESQQRESVSRERESAQRERGVSKSERASKGAERESAELVVPRVTEFIETGFQFKTFLAMKFTTQHDLY